MRKRIIGLALALAALGIALPASASLPSKTVADLTEITQITLQHGSSAQALLWVREEPSAFAVTQMQQIIGFLGQQEPISEFFPDEVKKEIVARNRETALLSELVMSEFVSIGIGDYTIRYGDVSGVFRFPTQYEETQVITVLAGYPGKDGIVTWQILETEPISGTLWILFPAELMLRIGHDAVLAVLSKSNRAG